MSSYLMAGQLSELERLQLQSRVWEPAGRRLLQRLGSGTGPHALDIGCGCYGWLPLLAEWAGDTGRVVGIDLDESLLAAAGELVAEHAWSQVELRRDDLFASALEPGSFDLVHARFQLAPLGRMDEQLDAYLRLVRPGGRLVLEDPVSDSWSWEPAAPALTELVDLIRRAFVQAGGDFDAGRRHLALLRRRGIEAEVRAEVTALDAGHPYLRLPVQFATSLRPRLLETVDEAALDALLARAEKELADPTRWGLTFTLIQTVATVT